MHVIEGIVEHGDARGRELGFRTANITMPQNDELDGVWGAYVVLPEGRRVVATVSVGRRATFYREGGEVLLEAHLLDFSEDLYGQKLRVVLTDFQRPQYEYDDVDSLIRQLHVDVAQTRERSHYPMAVPA
ncbi:riboflavin kinase [Glutamicibacter uratoxydans]|uniref:riboflavin kinase n=1 Tax=Glutamicibacter uratoxydans TaxID=43667 RepID=A0A4Y4DMH4_GLUUR|nr:riboflavin kinase [Glutamicibacter uratoxydans]GED05064.1 riboflavin kinase [Glutamicibacter uratoxydans]